MLYKTWRRRLLWGSRGEDPRLPLEWAEVPSLAQEVRSHMPGGVAKMRERETDGEETMPGKEIGVADITEGES